MKTWRRGRADTRGAAAVEFAIVLPLLLLLVLGGLDWGYYFFIAQVTTNAAREGARAGSLELDAGASQTAALAAVDDY
ncbi:MAG: pilus assembly protein, partial [Deltaproteobacteria bacterium]|nr:pilus assembly protein [Deltaproteobacteria bacterium]